MLCVHIISVMFSFYGQNCLLIIFSGPSCQWLMLLMLTFSWTYPSMFFRPSAIPGPVPDELVVPATESVGEFLFICDEVFIHLINFQSVAMAILR